MKYWEADKMTDKDFKDLQKIIDKQIEREIKIKTEDKKRKKHEQR
jgi:hypothetical protein